MSDFYKKIREYGEEMKGKFSHNPYGNGIVISVISPFFEEIHIDCCNEIYQEYCDPYSLLEPQENHPDIQGSIKRFYYNTQENCYYMSEWGPTEESGWGCTWVETYTKLIEEHTLRHYRLREHFRRYKEIHKGQLCIFTGYAIDPNGTPKRPSTVESMFDRHKWYYNPLSFEVKLLGENTIDDFVEETPISKEMTDKMVLHHREQAEIKRQKEEDDKEKNRKEKRDAVVNKINAHIEKYDKIYKYMVPGGFLWLLGTLIFGLIINR